MSRIRFITAVGLLFFLDILGNFQLTWEKSLVKPPRLPPIRPALKMVKRTLREVNETSPIRCTTGVFSAETGRWNNLPLLVDDTFELWELDVIQEAIWNLQEVIPCLTFQFLPRVTPPPTDHVVLVRGTNNGCNSDVGRQGGLQRINLQSPECFTVGMVTHQLLHTLGFHHEENRADRDNYVSIRWDNILPEHESAFSKLSSTGNTFNVDYDYNSLMHSDGYAFSKNGQATLIAKNGQRLWSKGKLQQSDIQKLQAMYPC